MPGVNPIKPLMRRLSAAGFNPKYVRTVVLPDWWEDGIADHPAGFDQAITLLSRNLCLDPSSLLDAASSIRYQPLPAPKYKLKSTDAETDVAVATRVAVRAADLVVSATVVERSNMPSSACEARESIQRGGAGSIGLTELLEYCWRMGVPVLHVSNFPTGVTKPDALAVMVGSRPVIVLCKQTNYSAWLLFHLAHELGHVVAGHMEGVSVLVDEEVRSDTDAEEAEANEFAVELITGHKRRSYNFGRQFNALNLANVAHAVARDTNVDPGFVALSHGRMTNNWSIACAALKRIEPTPNAIAIIRREMLRRLDSERLSEDSFEFLLRVTGADVTE